jgi:hypothetical protein
LTKFFFPLGEVVFTGGTFEWDPQRNTQSEAIMNRISKSTTHGAYIPKFETVDPFSHIAGRYFAFSAHLPTSDTDADAQLQFTRPNTVVPSAHEYEQPKTHFDVNCICNHSAVNSSQPKSDVKEIVWEIANAAVCIAAANKTHLQLERAKNDQRECEAHYTTHRASDVHSSEIRALQKRQLQIHCIMVQALRGPSNLRHVLRKNRATFLRLLDAPLATTFSDFVETIDFPNKTYTTFSNMHKPTPKQLALVDYYDRKGDRWFN